MARVGAGESENPRERMLEGGIDRLEKASTVCGAGIALQDRKFHGYRTTDEPPPVLKMLDMGITV